MKDLLIVGCGNMGEAILNRLALTDMSIVCIEVSEDRRYELKNRYTNVEFIAGITESLKVENVLLAIKPQIFGAFAEETSSKIECNGLISIMAGTTIDTIASYFTDKSIARIMPNTPALLGESASGFCLNKKAQIDTSFEKTVESILSTIGEYVKVSSEYLLDSVTGLSGSGPAYFFSIIDAMVEVGVKNGLTAKDAQKLAAQTMKGSAEMILKDEKSISELKYSVMSPGGTTAAGVSALESNGMRKAIHSCIDSAINKSKELGA